MPDEVTAAIEVAAQVLFDDWFDVLWSSKHVEIEVRRKSWTDGDAEVEGLHLLAPFGLGGDESEWHEAVRRRDGRGGSWEVVQPVEMAAQAIRERLAAVVA